MDGCAPLFYTQVPAMHPIAPVYLQYLPLDERCMRYKVLGRRRLTLG